MTHGFSTIISVQLSNKAVGHVKKFNGVYTGVYQGITTSSDGVTYTSWLHDFPDCTATGLTYVESKNNLCTAFYTYVNNLLGQGVLLLEPSDYHITDSHQNRIDDFIIELIVTYIPE